MRDRVFEAVARLRRTIPRESRLTQLTEPAINALVIERGLARPTWTYVRARGLRVADGPFAGLRYPRASAPHVPGLAARLAGTYEAELHPAVERLIARGPQLVVNIGAGDGLYAVGMALRCPQARVAAYELDPYAARVCDRLARANGVADRLTLRGECTVGALAEIEPAPETVVICDCEGCERELIDPTRVEWLARAPLLVEVHDSFDEELGALLAGRLGSTHSLEAIAPARRFLEDHPPLWNLPGLSPVQLDALISERRPWRTSWLLALPLASG